MTEHHDIGAGVEQRRPNAETIAAMQEALQIEAHPEKYKSYRDMESLRAALINSALDDIDNGAVPMDGKEFFDSMKTKYNK